ncbi:MAG: M23 family metallopeptidase [Anaerolineae bacterium]|nr:M23 family metallopeptidase [Chloroflexota bacterium]
MRLSRPLSSYVRITQRFNPSRHFGLDLSAYTGTPVYATVNGIAYGRVETRGFGRYVRIETPEAKVYSAHLDRYTVGDGQVVKRGQIIGYSGSTGNSTGPHLHLEVRRNAGSPFRHNAIDPWPLIDWDPAPANRRIVGLHLGNGCVLSGHDRRVITALKPGCVVVRPSSAVERLPITPADIAWILSVVPDCHVILRPQTTRQLSATDAGCRQYITAVLDVLAAWRKVVPGGRLHVQLWNQPNRPIAAGGTGFGPTEDAMVRFNNMFTEGYFRIKERFPDVRVGFPPLTPGFRDLWYPGNPSGRYYYHGTSGCRSYQLMTASDWSGAISSGPCAQALNAADELYVHTYVHDREGVKQCWSHARFGRRLEAIRYWWPTKPMWLTEYGLPNRKALDNPTFKRALVSHINYMIRDTAFVQGAALWTLGDHPSWGGRMFMDGDQPSPVVNDLTQVQGAALGVQSHALPAMTEDQIGEWVSNLVQDQVLPRDPEAPLYVAALQRNPQLMPASDECRPADLPISLPDNLPADIVCQVFRDPADLGWQEIAWTREGEWDPSQIRWIRKRD